MQKRKITVLSNLILLAILTAATVQAYYDTEDGPVAAAAKKAIETKNVNHALIWVLPEFGSEIKTAYQKTLYVRQLNPEAKELADKNFIETAVRYHNLGQNKPYTGIKKQTTDKIIILAEKAIETETQNELLNSLNDAQTMGIKTHYKAVRDKKEFDADDIDAGRQYVQAHINFMKYLQALQDAIQAQASEQNKEQTILLKKEQAEQQETAQADAPEQENLKNQLSFAWAIAATLAIIIVVLAIAHAMPKGKRK